MKEGGYGIIPRKGDMPDRYRTIVEELLASANIKINGTRRWDIRVLNDGFYRRVLSNGNLGMGESYMDGWWECGHIDELIAKILRSGLAQKAKRNARVVLHAIGAIVMNAGRRSKAFKIGERHYDLGNDLYKAMLDRNMVYSCGYWRKVKTPARRLHQQAIAGGLDEAQEAKLELIVKKIGLRKGMKVLDIGCGWGSFAEYAARKYGVRVVGTTVSREQAEFARKRCAGLPVEIRLEDYRAMTGTFDSIVSVGMFEHVGYKNYRTFMHIARRLLAPDGLFLLHTIGGNTSTIMTDPWIHKYIFPNGMIPSAAQISRAAEGLFVMEDWHNFGSDYDTTLMHWFHNFDKNWKHLAPKYGERFYRMWKYYLLSCAGAFRARHLQLWQIVLSPNGVPGGYRPVR